VFSALCGALPGTAVSAASSEPLKKRATYYTEEKTANARENISKYAWAKAEADETVKAADEILASLSLSDIWDLVPSQEIYRSYAVNQPKGCLNCGLDIDKFGNYPYTYNAIKDPWKITCPACGMRFPTNDFESYYKSGLDEKGVFHRKNADKQYLKNVLYPEKGEKWGVDDGTSYVHTNGEKYFFIAYYAHWAVWGDGNFYGSTDSPEDGILTKIADLMSLAYIYTGDQKYADACIVLLERVAELYPTYNIKDCPWSAGYRHSGVSNGSIVGCIWETRLVDHYTLAFDAMFSAYPHVGAEALKLLSDRNPKISTYKDLMRTFEDGFLKEIYNGVSKGAIAGNNGMKEHSLACAAVVLDSPGLSDSWLNYVFNNCVSVFNNSIDADGWGTEASPTYNSLWLSKYIRIAKMLRGYKVGGSGASYDLFNNARFKKMLSAIVGILATEKFVPCIGDTGYTGVALMSADRDGSSLDSEGYLLEAYLTYKDDVYAQMLYMLIKDRIDDLRLSIWEKDPEQIGAKIKKVVDEKGEYVLSSHMLASYGLALIMNATESGYKAADPEKSSESFTASGLSVINEGKVKGVSKTESGVVFSPSKAGDSFSVGFKTVVAAGEYDISASLTGKTDKYSVFLDGALIKRSPEAGGALLAEKHRLTPGFHVLTFRCSEPEKLTLGGIDVSGEEKAVKPYVNPETVAGIYFGRNTGHGHADTLNLYLFGFGIDLAPDLGYPEFCDGTPNQVYWVSNSISHNLVVVNDARQGANIVAQPRGFDDDGFVKLMSVDANGVYPNASRYGRTTALIRIDGDDSYVADFFIVTGGVKHTYSFHPAESSALTTTGLELVKQTGKNGNYLGTVLGLNTPWGSGSSSTGFQYLDKVSRDTSPEGVFSFDWTLVDTRDYTDAEDIHLKMTMHNQMSRVILANGTPPRNKPDNPAGLDYVLAEKSTKKEKTTFFTTVFEPYIASSAIASQERCTVYELSGEKASDAEISVLKITLKSGRTDYICCGENEKDTFVIDGKFTFRGFFGVYSVLDEKEYRYNFNSSFGTYAAPEEPAQEDPALNESSGDASADNEPAETGAAAETEVTAYTGYVRTFTRELTDKNTITVTIDHKDADIARVIGKYMYVKTADRNGCYKILDAKKSGSLITFDIGDVSPIRYGSVYNIAVTSRFTIPLSSSSGQSGPGKADEMFGLSSLTDAVFAGGVSPDASAGDKAGYVFIVNRAASKAEELPSYEISVVKDKYDGEYFKCENGALVLTEKFGENVEEEAEADKTEEEVSRESYRVLLKIRDPGTGAVYEKDVTVPVTQSGLDEISAEIFAETSDAGPAEWIPIAVIAAVCAAVIAAILISVKKKKAAK